MASCAKCETASRVRPALNAKGGVAAPRESRPSDTRGSSLRPDPFHGQPSADFFIIHIGSRFFFLIAQESSEEKGGGDVSNAK